MFPWANGGNLLNHWKKFDHQRSDLNNHRWIIGQLKGLCSALKELHENNTRHGDLKPENILWFKDQNDHGTFQIADMGLATFHEKEKHTKDRQGMITMTPSGTSRYEPPEMNQTRANHDTRSRQYDIWSMGCVLLELLLWLLYGYEAVDIFNSRTPHFWLEYDDKYIVHPYVDSCMRAMVAELSENTAHKDLLILVKQRLLIVPVSKDYGSFPEYREIAATLHDRITAIEQKCQTQSPYLALFQLPYPSDKIREQEVNQRRTASLQVPQQQGVPRLAGARLNSPNTDDEPTPGVFLRRPTGEVNSDSLSTTKSSIPEHQQVSQVDSSRT